MKEQPELVLLESVLYCVPFGGNLLLAEMYLVPAFFGVKVIAVEQKCLDEL